MAVFWSDPMAAAIVNAIIRQVAFPLPAACYAALYTDTAEPTATGAGSAVECGFTNYLRPALTTAIMAAPIANSRQTVSSGGVITFGTPTAAIDARPLAWIALWATQTGSLAANYLGYGPLTSPVTPLLNQALVIATSNLTIRQT